MAKHSRLRKLKLLQLWHDDNFLRGMHWVENFVSKILSVALIVVILVSIYDLILVLSTQLFVPPTDRFINTTLLEIFGLFLNVLIALELLENITAYLKKHILQVELVVMTALIAVARKIIIFDPSKYDKVDLASLAIAIFALSISYWLIRVVNRKPS